MADFIQSDGFDGFFGRDRQNNRASNPGIWDQEKQHRTTDRTSAMSLPSSKATATIANPIEPAIKAYSIKVAPLSSRSEA
jgi:hypothetical protein